VHTKRRTSRLGLVGRTECDLIDIGARCAVFEWADRAPEDPSMRLAVQIALDIVLAWLICLSIAVAVLVAVRVRERRYLDNPFKASS
jgi:hypothetical protein